MVFILLFCMNLIFILFVYITHGENKKNEQLNNKRNEIENICMLCVTTLTYHIYVRRRR